ncbi:GDSL-type esterase/lipase family protein [Pseudonocardia oroxyli]|uniref:von Willebrand factor type A domain-containing protein n=1 Tax=Pseudonocardia oroxyli TaxID=366584 RepID=A0A1G8BCR9_PSEOR|nr:GDSL-type esterase/lipase family protein [Pseudonocardia oroxyli]SDH30999.1 von Willebrand factor type A domain-containing protein [Pseudonocardia oroxyli]
MIRPPAALLVLVTLLLMLPGPAALAATPGPGVGDPYSCGQLLESSGALGPGQLRTLGERRSGIDLVPVLFVHGFNSSDGVWRRDPSNPANDPVLDQGVSVAPDLSTTFAERVLAVQGTVGFSFDYSAAALQWVTDPAIAPALGTVIDCLARTTSNRVVVVAHSMGGLATRLALATPERAARVSTVITLGTPNTGSVLAGVGEVAGQAVPTAAAKTALDLVLASCTRNLTHSGSDGCGWPGLKNLAAGNTPAGLAMRPGTLELAALPPWPDSVRVVAMAGRVTLSVGALVPGVPLVDTGAIGLGIDAEIGDVVVGVDSAVAGADSEQVFDCRPGGLNALLRARAAAGSPCMHTNLPRLADAAIMAASATKRAVLAELADTDPVVVPRPRTDPGPLVFLVDTSSSMAEKDAAGAVRLEAAQTSLLNQIRTISDRRAAALWTYPASGGNCSAGGYRLPPTLGAAPRLDAEIRALRPSGDTPTGPALRALVASLQAAGESRATIVLVSDGESNCSVDPCTVAESVRAQGFDLQVDTVGFQISEKGRAELECIAGRTGGSYLDVDDGDTLGERLRTTSQPVLDPVLSAPTTASPGTEVTVEASLTNAGAVTATDVNMTLRAELVGPDGAVTGFTSVRRPAVRLGNLAAGAGGRYAWTVTMPTDPRGGSLRVVLVTTSEETATRSTSVTLTLRTGLTSADLGPILRDAAAKGTAVVLGDSFSAGEGAGDYEQGIVGVPDLCHRSPHTYAEDLFPNGRVVLACSGAQIPALTTSQWQEGDPVLPQLRQLEDLPDSIGPVLLTMGGNDIGFAGIVKRCAGPGDCIAEDERTSELLDGLAERLAGAYADIDRVANSADRRAQRGGSMTPIIVLAYPQLVTRQNSNRCPALSRNEADQAVALVDKLNAQISAGVEQARAVGVPVLFAEDVSQALLPTHTVCSDEPWANPIYDLRDPRLYTQPAFRNEKMHPTAEGYRAFTAALIRWSQRPQVALPDRLASGSATLVTSTETGAELQLAPDTTRVRRGETVTLAAAGFAPGSDVLVVQRSVVAALGAGTADNGGVAHLTVTLPASAAVGGHHVVVVGIDPDGRPHEVAAAVHVSGEAPLWLWLAGGGLLTAALAGLVLLAVRRARSDSTTSMEANG